jgi:hypothetical protein
MHIAGVYDIIRIGLIRQASGVEVTELEPNLGPNEISPRGEGIRGMCHDAKVASTNVQLEGTILWREDM